MEAEILRTRYGIDEENLDRVVEDAKDYAIYKGIAQRMEELPKDVRVPLAFCVVPSTFPQKWFDYGIELQPHINYLLHQVSYSKDFLKECLTSTIEADEFIANIFNIYEAVDRTGKKQPLSLGLLRSDYLLNSNSSGDVTGMKQVENNTFASSIGGLSPGVRELQMYILDRLKVQGFDKKMPENDSLHELAKGIVFAWDAYENPNAIVVFVVEELSINICDQRALEYAIVELESQVHVLRCTFAELRTTLKLVDDVLFVKGKEVAVVYYRMGYLPEHYQPEDWKTRLLIEQSSAIKCPSVGLHLAGTKKVQSYLTRPGVLERFLPDNIARKMRLVFAHQYALDMDEEGDKAVSLGIQHFDKFVLKPDREGGGNNLYGEELKNKLIEVGKSKERQAYILMEKIKPPPIPNCIAHWKKPSKPCNIACEFGIFGFILGDKENIYFNNASGHTLRSKVITSNEGGIAAGIGALDSPYLV